MHKIDNLAQIEERINNIINKIEWKKCRGCGDLVPVLDYGLCLECRMKKDKEPLFAEEKHKKWEKQRRFWTIVDRFTHPILGFLVGWVMGLIAFWLQSLIWG